MLCCSGKRAGVSTQELSSRMPECKPATNGCYHVFTPGVFDGPVIWSILPSPAISSCLFVHRRCLSGKASRRRIAGPRAPRRGSSWWMEQKRRSGTDPPGVRVARTQPAGVAEGLHGLFGHFCKWAKRVFHVRRSGAIHSIIALILSCSDGRACWFCVGGGA